MSAVVRTVAPAAPPSAVRTIDHTEPGTRQAIQVRPRRIVRPAKVRIVPLSRGGVSLIGAGWIVSQSVRGE
ncbi:hypothetical protein Psuf_089670 [Phytohabitans suffuscus]|uniref:Uncharacterized protein n=1 Tax=Phytohabitans suffuscus TaxID=624315 RepID=A0A6F8Z008_9ACTN|nr:hypothetical protein Psuf_089670 [Phytohabitans suffuscus]